MKKTYRIIGLMSGTSMDGIDLSLADYTYNGVSWTYELLQTQCFSYDVSLLESLSTARTLSVEKLLELDKRLGLYFANKVNHFLTEIPYQKESIHAIASHGHTVHHRPEIGFTCQIGCGDTMAFHTGLPVVNDFRQKDVVAGGQGAPLVPIGDLLLFSGEADSYLNIGGFCNICIRKEKTIAFDICPGNLPLNNIANQLGYNYDNGGELAKSGALLPELLEQLAKLEFYQIQPPKSLGTEWLDQFFYPLLPADANPTDILRTIIEHESLQISSVLNKFDCQRVLVTGGGAKNSFLTGRIAHYFKGKIIIPSASIIDFKEALIFGFLAALYFEKQPNCIPEVTGASKAVCSGVLHTP